MPVRPDIYIHEEVERRRKRIRHDVQFPKLGTQIVVTVRVVARCAVLDAIHLEATRRIEKVVPANVVGDALARRRANSPTRPSGYASIHRELRRKHRLGLSKFLFADRLLGCFGK